MFDILQDSLPVVACGTGKNSGVTLDTGHNFGIWYKISDQLFLNPMYAFYGFLFNASGCENNLSL